MPLPILYDKELTDQYAKENFVRLRAFFLKETPWLGFRFFEVEFKAAATDFGFTHNMGFQPKDAILSSVTNGATVVFKYDQFDKTNAVISVSAACVIRFILGAFT